MNRALVINIVRSIIGLFCIGSGVGPLMVLAGIMGLCSLWCGCHWLLSLEKAPYFRGKPYFYSDFIVCFDLLFPLALVLLLFASGAEG